MAGTAFGGLVSVQSRFALLNRSVEREGVVEGGLVKKM